MRKLSGVYSDQELPTIIPEDFYDKYRIVFSEYNLDKKIARIGLNEKQRRAQGVANDCRGIIALPDAGNRDGISGERYSLRQFGAVSGKIPQGQNFVN